MELVYHLHLLRLGSITLNKGTVRAMSGQVYRWDLSRQAIESWTKTQ